MIMLTFNEATSAVFGAYRLARFDRNGMAFIDRSPEGALNSFYAAVLLLPFFIFAELLHLWSDLAELSLLRVVAVDGIAYVISWTLFPVIMLSAVGAFDRQQRYFDFLATYNWSNVIQAGIYFPVLVLGGFGLLPEPVIIVLALAATAAVLVYAWFVIKTSLDIAGPLAVALVGADFMISLALTDITDGMIYSG